MVAGGPVFGRYEILGTLGRGGFAVVYHVRDRSLGREVALKSLLPHLAEAPEVHSRFLGEARAIARLTHPNIITIYDVNEAEGRPFYTMELIHGHTLAELLGGELLDFAQVNQVMQPLAAAIDYLHAAGMIHRDIKPANVMLDTRGRVVLMDFGIARVLDQTHYTRTNMTIGTPAYMAPEQIAGGVVGPAADIYSLGIIAYEMLAGRPPFEGTTAQLLYAQVNLPPPSLSALRRDLPSAVLATIDAALAKEPGRRPASAALSVLPSASVERPLPPTVTVPTGARAETTLATPPSPAATQPWTASQPTQPIPLAKRLASRRTLILAAGTAAVSVLGSGAVALVLGSRSPVRNSDESKAITNDFFTDSAISATMPPTFAATSAASSATRLTPQTSAASGSPTAATADFGTAAPVATATATPSATSNTSRTIVPAHVPIPLDTVSTFAGAGAFGTSDSGGFADGPSALARFAYPQGVAVDRDGNVYVPDLQNHRLRKISAAGDVTTLAGSGVPGLADGRGIAAQFNYPAGVAVDGVGNVYVSDYYNHRIRKVTSDGVVTTLSGSGPSGRTAGGFADGPGNVARFNLPAGLAVDAQGNIYVADLMNNRVRRLAADGRTTTVAGSGRTGYTDGPATEAQFNDLAGVAVTAEGTIFVADFNNNRVRRISTAGTVDTYAGSGAPGLTDGPGASAQFNGPTRLAIDPAGNLYVADLNNQAIRRVATDGTVKTIAGGNGAGYTDGPIASARFNQPEGIAIDSIGNLYVADADNNRVRRISP